MLKILNTLFVSLCIATVLSEIVGLGLLWQRGYLSREMLQAVRVALNDEEETEEKAPKDEEAPEMSLDDQIIARAKIDTDFDNRHRQLNNLEKMIREEADQITVNQQTLEETRKQFLAELEALRKRNLDESTEQGRGILMALPPDEAARKLMQLTIEEDLVLLKGISEKKIADILQEMVEPEAAKRGQEIFHRLSTGGLIDQLAKETASQVQPAKKPAPAVN